MKDLIIAIGSGAPGESPLMPFVAKRFDGKVGASLARVMLEIALLRCGFDIFDRSAPVPDAQELVLQANRVGADGRVLLSCSAFGSRKSFNDVCGPCVKYSSGRLSAKSRELAEDVCAKVSFKPCAINVNHEFNGAAAPAIVIEYGYLTNFDEAKLLCDPDYIHKITEYAAMGICEYFGMPYIPHTASSYSRFNAKLGSRGKSVKLLQNALRLCGYSTVVDGVYGKNTEIAVKEFCINNESEKVLRDALLVSPGALALGSKHSGVLYLQRKLASKLYCSIESGTLCADTVDAVNEFLTDTENTRYISDSGVTKEAFALLSEIGGGKPRLF